MAGWITRSGMVEVGQYDHYPTASRKIADEVMNLAAGLIEGGRVVRDVSHSVVPYTKTIYLITGLGREE